MDSITAWEVPQLIEFLALKGKLNNIIIGKNVAGMTTKIKLTDVTVGDALEIVLSLNNLAYEIKGGIVTIMTDEEYKKLRGTSFYDYKQVKMHALKYADPTRVSQMLEKVKSEKGIIVADQVTGSLILLDAPDKLIEMMRIIEKADIPTIKREIPAETKVFRLRYANIEEIQAEITSLISTKNYL